MQHGRIFIKSEDALFNFMWAGIATDGSILMGLTHRGIGAIELVSDPDFGELRAQNLVSTKKVEELKISFHATGHYKLSGRMGRQGNAIDRITVIGPRLADITEPRRMAEILLPDCLPLAMRKPSDHDIILDITQAPPPPYRCVISCMTAVRFVKFVTSNDYMVDTSVWECTQAFTNGPQAWTWTFYKSKNDKQIPTRFLIFLPGLPKWGQASDADIKP